MLYKLAKQFAPGLPSKNNYGNLRKLPANVLLDYVAQLHNAKRAGKHIDFRIGAPNLGLYSWAIPKATLPKPGQKLLAVQQPLHEYPYINFKGRLPEGYGEGTVKPLEKGKLVITSIKPGKITFTLGSRKHPERFALIKTEGKNWLLINTTPTKSKAHDIYKKVHYKVVQPNELSKMLGKDYAAQKKLDGAAALAELLKDRIEVYSYRKSKQTGWPILHTERLQLPSNLKIPKELVGTVLRGEIYGVRKGKVIPPMELGGLLNASLEKSLKEQQRRNIEMKAAIFNILNLPKKLKNKVDEDFVAKQNLIDEILAKTGLKGKLHTLPYYTSPKDIERLYKRIKSKRDPETKEGLVFHPLKGGKPVKLKFKEDADVIIKKIFPAETKSGKKRAGGFWYSLPGSNKIVGKVGTGFTHAILQDMLKHPENYIGRRARITAQEQFPSGAYRAPSFLALHEDY